jgi:seryl-tRNA synthetase
VEQTRNIPIIEIRFKKQRTIKVSSGKWADMAENRGWKDKSLEALDFIINVLREHEQNLDKSIDQLATVTEQISGTEELNGKLEKADEKLDNLLKELTSLVRYLANPPKEAAPTGMKERGLQAQEASALSPVVFQAGVSVILNCTTWADFQILAIHPQTLTFSYDENEKVFRANALKGNQMITYAGAPPSFPLILKMWLSRQLDVAEHNIFEGSLDKPK